MNTPQPVSDRLPQRVLQSHLMELGGCVIDDGIAKPVIQELLEESNSAVPKGTISLVEGAFADEIRGGNPSRRFISAPGGKTQQRFYHSRQTAERISEICQCAVKPTGEGGTFTYYARAGDYLALHRDIRTCDLAVITCLLDRHQPGSGGGLTKYYPSRWRERLSQIRASPQRGAVTIRLPVGHTMILLGGVIPHEIQPLVEGELRIVSILCYELA